MILRSLVIFGFLMSFSFVFGQHKLWYDKPATDWEEALPIGNGRLGAMVYGGDNKETLQFNEETLWTGEPRSYVKQGAYRYLDSIRTLIDEGKQRQAEELAQREFMGVKGITEELDPWLEGVSRERNKPNGAYSPKFDDKSWNVITLPSYEGWETVGHEGLNGAVWFRKEFSLSKDDLNEDWTLDLNKVRQQDYTYINGVLIGQSNGENEKRNYLIRKENLRVGKNVIAVQVINVEGKGGIAGYKDTTERIGLKTASGRLIPLGGEWRYWIQDAKPPRVGDYQEAYQPFGEVNFTFASGERTDYKRSLDLEEGIAKVVYKQSGVEFSRTYLASYPDNVIAVQLTASQPAKISFSVGISSKHKQRRVWKVNDQTLGMSVSVSEGAMKGTCLLSVEAQGGTVVEKDGVLSVSSANSATVYLSAATNFKDFTELNDDYSKPLYRNHQDVVKIPFAKVLARHQADYKSLYSRFSVDLGKGVNSDLPTNKRIEKFDSASDPDLVALYMQYGRYLQIAASRKGTQPMNLQGIWNHLLEPSWGSKYTTNINLEMNYWPTEMLNLSELHEPLFKMITELSHAGRETAKEYYNARGWVLHHNTDIWRGTAPINNSNHGIWPTGGAWLVTHLWEHYLFNQDPEFIIRYYDIIKGSVLFFKDVLVLDKETGWLISSPSNSPENGGLVKGPTMDHQIIRALFQVFTESSKLVGKDAELRDSITALIPKIAPNQIGRYGQLQEWMADVDDPNNKHRHVSHLWGLHPGNEINMEETPDLVNAAKQSLIMRGDDGTGWSLAWKINFWARLKDAQHTYTMIKMLLRPAGKAGGSYPNLFDAHPPFQIDGNFGGAAGIGELLLQSHSKYIDILPALPKELAQGTIKGIKARGNFELDISWRESMLTGLRVKSNAGRLLRLRYNGKIVEIRTKKNMVYTFDSQLNQTN